MTTGHTRGRSTWVTSRAARLADGIFANVTPEKFVEQVRWVLDECERIGRDPSAFRFIHYSVLLPGLCRLRPHRPSIAPMKRC